MQRKKVLHVSLEMSQTKVSQRYVQSLLSITKKEGEVTYPYFKNTEDGIEMDINFRSVKRKSFRDPEIAKHIRDKLTAHKGLLASHLLIKDFPTGKLTIKQFESYLDYLDRFNNFHPDVILFDYPDLMQVGTGERREAIGTAFENLRGIASERNLAMVTVTQGNRLSATAKLVTEGHVAEDWSKIATADNVVTYSQTAQEKEIGLCRLFVSNSRNEEDKFSVLVSQSYPMGQFCMQSVFLRKEYWKTLDDLDVEDDAGDD